MEKLKRLPKYGQPPNAHTAVILLQNIKHIIKKTSAVNTYATLSGIKLTLLKYASNNNWNDYYVELGQTF